MPSKNSFLVTHLFVRNLELSGRFRYKFEVNQFIYTKGSSMAGPLNWRVAALRGESLNAHNTASHAQAQGAQANAEAQPSRLSTEPDYVAMINAVPVFETYAAAAERYEELKPAMYNALGDAVTHEFHAQLGLITNQYVPQLEALEALAESEPPEINGKDYVQRSTELMHQRNSEHLPVYNALFQRFNQHRIDVLAQGGALEQPMFSDADWPALSPR